MSTPRIHIPPPLPIEFVLLAAAMAFVIVSLTSCNGVTPNGPLSIASNQSFAAYKSKQYYPTGQLKSTMEIEGYVGISPNPELTGAVKDVTMMGIGTKGLVDITEATVANPNKTPALARDPNTLKRNPNVTVKDVNKIPEIPLNPNVIPK